MLSRITNKIMGRKLGKWRSYTTNNETKVDKVITNGAETGRMDQTITNETIVNGQKVIESTRIVKTWDRLSIRTRACIASYLTVLFGHYSYLIYEDGKTRLINYRNTSKTHNDISGLYSEWDAVKLGCNTRPGLRFVESLVFPYTVVTNLMPRMVLWLNPAPAMTSPTPLPIVTATPITVSDPKKK